MIPDWSNKTIAIAEDDIYTVQLIQKMLRDTLVKIIVVNTGQKIVELIDNNNQIDLVIMDIELPFVSGMDATKLIKANKPHLPVIMETAYFRDYIEEDCLKCGCNEFMIKPFSKEKLITALSAYLS